MEETKPQETKPNNNKKKKLGLVVPMVVVIIGAVSLFFYLGYEKTRTAQTVAQAQVKAAREQVVKAEKALETRKSVVRQVESLKAAQGSAVREKEAKFDAAQLNYGYTKIYAPSDGYISKKSVELGNQIKVGQPLMAVVSLDDIHIAANYKETQLKKIRPGQKVKVKVDTYPGKRFSGKVESIMAGTGAVFSLFPPENATGNYMKVVQRIPVTRRKI